MEKYVYVLLLVNAGLREVLMTDFLNNYQSTIDDVNTVRVLFADSKSFLPGALKGYKLGTLYQRLLYDSREKPEVII